MELYADGRKMKKTWSVIKFLLFILLVYITGFIWTSLPLINGYAAKTMCSDVFVSRRTLADINANELGSFPFNLSSVTVDTNDSSVTASMAGLASRKAIFRKGLGATLVSGMPETVVRNESFNLPVAPAVNQDSINWPAGNKLTQKPEDGIDTVALQKAIRYAFDEPSHKPARRTRAVIVIYKGQIIAEEYAAGFNAHSIQLGWSMAKGIENALLGILIKRRQLQLNAPAPIPEWKKDERNKITINDLLHMSSGLHYASSAAGPSDLTEMLFRQSNMGVYGMRAATEHPPGTVFHYADASANILSFIERKLLGDQQYYRFPYESLFYKIGMNSALLEVDASGTFVGSSYCYATARDWARFGLLYLNDGVWNNERILPEGWVRFTSTPTTARNEENKGAYGALWWVNKPDSRGIVKYPRIPADCISCQGYEGQFVAVIPSKKLVVVRLALERADKLDGDKFLADVINSLPE